MSSLPRPAISRWLPEYKRSWLGSDIVSGITVSAVLIPSALSYAVIVGVEPIVGLHTVPLVLVAYAIFGGSKLLVAGPDAAISVLAASAIAAVATSGDQLDAMIALSLLVGGFFVLFSLLRMGWIADLVPDPVLRGFIQGLVWTTILSQVTSLLGIELSDVRPSFWLKTVDIVRHLGDAHATTATLGLGCLAALLLLRRFAPLLPGSVIVLGVALAAVALLGLADEGVAVVGEPSGGLFGFALPSGLTRNQWVGLVPGALAIVVVGFTESIGAATSAAQKTGERLDPDEELLALGASNLAAGVSGGYAVTGALSKTGVAIASGGKTQVGNLVAAGVAVLATVVLRPLFEQLASAVLAALIVVAMLGIARVQYFVNLWKVSRSEFGLALLTFVGVLSFGVLPGVMIGVVLSLVLLIAHMGRPIPEVLGRTPDGAWRSVDGAADAVEVPGLVVWRQDAPVVFLNARRTANLLREVAVDGVEMVVFVGSPTSMLDSTGLTAMLTARDDLAARGVETSFVNPSLAKQTNLEIAAGVSHLDLPATYKTIDLAVAAYELSRRGR